MSLELLDADEQQRDPERGDRVGQQRHQDRGQRAEERPEVGDQLHQPEDDRQAQRQQHENASQRQSCESLLGKADFGLVSIGFVQRVLRFCEQPGIPHAPGSRDDLAQHIGGPFGGDLPQRLDRGLSPGRFVQGKVRLRDRLSQRICKRPVRLLLQLLPQGGRVFGQLVLVLLQRLNSIEISA